jgi:hypothetical protein
MRERTNEGKGVKGKEETARGGTKSEGIKRRKKKKNIRSLDTERKGGISRAISNAISGAIRIIVNKVHYPTYCAPS